MLIAWKRFYYVTMLSLKINTQDFIPEGSQRYKKIREYIVSIKKKTNEIHQHVNGGHCGGGGEITSKYYFHLYMFL